MKNYWIISGAIGIGIGVGLLNAALDTKKLKLGAKNADEIIASQKKWAAFQIVAGALFVFVGFKYIK